MKEICKNCVSCSPTYKGQLCSITGKKVRQQDSCKNWKGKAR